MVLSGTLARQSSTAALLAPSLTIFPDPVRTLAILLLLEKCERFYFFIETAVRGKVFVLGR
jgi:hypothetical protein